MQTENLRFIVPSEIVINIKLTLCALSLDHKIIGYLDLGIDTSILLDNDVTINSAYVKRIASEIKTIIDHGKT